jgi:tetratricopeptide (TPR) repeat protein
MQFIRLLLALCLCFGAIPLRASTSSLPDPQTFSVVIERGDLNRAREWLDAGLPPDFVGVPIGSGLMIGAWTGNIAMMELFLVRGADVNHTNALGEQAIQHAAWRGQMKALRWLIERGARINREGWQWSALHYAAFAGHDEAVAYLLDHGADVDARSTNGSTPLMMAAREGRDAIAVRLLKARADVSLRNEWDDDAVRFAERNNNERIAKLIRASDTAPRRSEPETPRVAQPAAVRSQPLPDSVERMLARARALEAEGKREAALAAFRTALAALRAVERKTQVAAPEARLQGVRISARRDAPKEQTTELRFAPGGGQSSQVAARGEGAASESSPSASPSSTAPLTSSADELLAQARAAEAAGNRREALDLFRRAAARLRSTD